MSHYPPTGPPPPYYGQGYPPPAPAPMPAGYTYVPAPVMMPVFPPQPPPEASYQPPPTYVNNHYYPSPPPEPEPVRVVEHIHVPQEDPIDWAPASTTNVSALTHKAFVAGKEAWDGSPLCIIRAHHNGDFVPGKLAIKHKAAYIPHGGKEVPVHNFEVLIAKPEAVRWLPHSNGQVPVGAIAAGNTHKAEPLYIGRVRHLRSITPGKIHPSHGCCYISFGGAEILYKDYEVLCKVVG